METLDFLILGPFQVLGCRQPLALGGPRQRAVLALLLLNRREVVATDCMIDELWGEYPPATVGKAIQVYVSNLRKVVGDGVLVTSDGGYKLDVEPNQVDADRFDALVTRGRTALERGCPDMARQRLREALGLWRGRPLADFSYHQFAQAEIARLEEARIAALEDRIEADLGAGKHSTLVPELETHVRAHPARERLWGHLMVALYRSGRQADALERYRRARRVLIDEFAIEPGQGLKDLERSILTQDPALDPPTLDTRVGQKPARCLPDPIPEVPRGLPPTTASAGALGSEAASEPPASEPTSSEIQDHVTAAPRVVLPLLRPAILRARVADLSRSTDAHWHERRLMIAAGASLVLVAVIVVAVLTSVGGSQAGRGAPLGPDGCSHCVASISAPRSGAVYGVGQPATTSFSCVNGAHGPSPVSCDDSTGGHTKNGGHGRLDTSTPGLHIYTVTLTARGGVTKTATVSYRVVAPLATSIGMAVAKVAHHRARITLQCTGGQPGATCRGTLQLRIRRLIGGRLRLVGIARATYAASTDSSDAIVLRLTHLGMRALRRAPGHHRRVQLIVARRGGATVKRMIRLQLG